MTCHPSPVHGSCSGSLIVHVVDGTAAGCALDEEPDAAARVSSYNTRATGRHASEFGGCNSCGLHGRLESQSTARTLD
jgi:hypothetical protein